MTKRLDLDSMMMFVLNGKPGGLRLVSRVSGDGVPSGQAAIQQSVTSIGGVACAERVRDPVFWWQLYEKSPANAACINAKARDIVGGDIGVGNRADGPAFNETFLAELGAVLDRSQHDIQEACRDAECTGWGTLELIPTSLGGRLYKLQHMDSWTTWRSLDGLYVMQQREGKTAKFLSLENPQPGEFHRVAWFNNQHWFKNSYYGVPDVIPVIQRIEIAFQAVQYNSEFLRRRGGYRWLMLVSSPAGYPAGQSASGDEKLIREVNYYFTEAGRASEADLISVPLGQRTAVLQKLDADVKDLDFPTLFNFFRDDVLMAHGVPPLKAGIVQTGALGGNVGQEQLRAYRDNVVSPKQEQWERFLESILLAWYGTAISVDLSPVEIDELREMAFPLKALYAGELISRRELRGRLGFPDVDNGADIWASELLDFEMSTGEPGAAPQ